WMPERVQAARRLVGLTREPALQEAIVEGGSEHRWRISRDAVQSIESAGSHQPTRVRKLPTPRWTTHRELVDVRERGDRVHQRVAGEERGLAQLREDLDPGPPPWNEGPLGVRVVPPLAARGEIEESAGLRRRLALVTAPAAGGLRRGGNATELRPNSD